MRKFYTVLTGLLLLATFSIFPSLKVNGLTQNLMTRNQVEQRALTMTNLKWTYDRNKNGQLNSSVAAYVTAPSQFLNISTVQACGIPYNWGGADSLDSSSYNEPWSNYLDAVYKGAFVGNVNTKAGLGHIDGTAGIDCSGFVQAAFNIKATKLSTSTLFDNYFTKTSLSEIRHMDILDKPGDHVVIFDKWGTYNGTYGAYTYESTPDCIYGGIQGTKKYFISMNEINKGYIPGRYINLREDTTQGNVGSFAQITKVNYAANFRTASSQTSTLIGTIPKSTIIYLIDFSSGFYQVSYNGQVGWISDTLITLVPTGKYVSLNNVSQLNIRNNPAVTATIVGVLKEKEYAEVIGYSSDSKWLKIIINGIQGYASGKYLNYIQ